MKEPRASGRDYKKGGPAAVDGVVRSVLVDPGTEARSAEPRGALQLHR